MYWPGEALNLTDRARNNVSSFAFVFFVFSAFSELAGQML